MSPALTLFQLYVCSCGPWILEQAFTTIIQEHLSHSVNQIQTTGSIKAHVNVQFCRRRSFRRCDRCLTLELGPDNRAVRGSSSIFSIIKHSAHCSYSQSHVKDTALRESGVVETIWTSYMTEPSSLQDAGSQAQRSTDPVAQDKCCCLAY